MRSFEDTEIHWDNSRLCGYYCARRYPNSARGADEYILLHRFLQIWFFVMLSIYLALAGKVRVKNT